MIDAGQSNPKYKSILLASNKNWAWVVKSSKYSFRGNGMVFFFR